MDTHNANCPLNYNLKKVSDVPIIHGIGTRDNDSFRENYLDKLKNYLKLEGYNEINCDCLTESTCLLSKGGSVIILRGILWNEVSAMDDNVNPAWLKKSSLILFIAHLVGIWGKYEGTFNLKNKNSPVTRIKNFISTIFYILLCLIVYLISLLFICSKKYPNSHLGDAHQWTHSEKRDEIKLHVEETVFKNEFINYPKTIIAHSQGGSIISEILRGGSHKNINSVITLGSGALLLSVLNELSKENVEKDLKPIFRTVLFSVVFLVLSPIFLQTIAEITDPLNINRSLVTILCALIIVLNGYFQLKKIENIKEIIQRIKDFTLEGYAGNDISFSQDYVSSLGAYYNSKRFKKIFFSGIFSRDHTMYLDDEIYVLPCIKFAIENDGNLEKYNNFEHLLESRSKYEKSLKIAIATGAAITGLIILTLVNWLNQVPILSNLPYFIETYAIHFIVILFSILYGFIWHALFPKIFTIMKKFLH